jgi:uncharacterized 2Fe-2S/4Fe-4S cluster protein (DUF4445 family)
MPCDDCSLVLSAPSQVRCLSLLLANDFGLSVDVGTTHITIHLVRLIDQLMIHELVIPNPQISVGADIITRAAFATRIRQNAAQLSALVRSAVESGINTLLKQAQISPLSVKQIVVVGNTVMHHLFFNLSVSSLTRSPYVAEDKEAIVTTAKDIGFTQLPEAECYSPPLVESFIGADAPAVMLACGFLSSEINRIAIDVGTNTEIAVKSSRGVWIASAASGPAFEGMSMECGMLGQIGAISNVEIDHRTLRPKLEILGAKKPHGICGTGAISSLAAMLDAKILLPTGSLNRSLNSRWLVLDSAVSYYVLADRKTSATGQPIVISQPDVRMLQQSKAAVRGVIDVLLQESGLTTSDVESFCITGVFGTDLQVKDANRIGMFPRFLNAKIEQKSKSANLGAEMLFSETNREKLDRFLKGITYVEMSDNPAFKKQFVASIPFPDQ